MIVNRAAECRQRADECRREAAQVDDDLLRGAYLDLARRWRMMARQAESLEQKAETKNRSGAFMATFSGAFMATFRIALAFLLRAALLTGVSPIWRGRRALPPEWPRFGYRVAQRGPLQ
jgi:hypothetical protein